MKKRVLILLESASNGPLYIEAAQRLNLHPITLSADPSHIAGCETICIDTDNVDAMIHECSKLSATTDLAGITSARESAYAAVGKLCQYFDLPGPNHEAIERCCNKFTQSRLLTEAGVPVPAFRLAADARGVEHAAAQIGLPVVVKPTVGIGSRGVRLCRDVRELAGHTDYLLSEGHLSRPSSNILVEEFAHGAHYSVEVMGNEVIGIGAAEFGDPPHFVCREYIYPALLSEDQHSRIVDLSLSCLKALGLGWGPKNIDVRWTEHGPVVIEVNPRLAGTPNSQLVKLAYGIDLITEHIKLVIGEEWNLPGSHSHTAAARILVPDQDCIVDSISGDSQAAAVPGVHEVKIFIGPKTPIVRKGDERDKIGHVIAASPDLAETKAILQLAVDLIDWSMTPISVLGHENYAAGA
ncbi:ATP-grasp domain-containing protein [Rhizobium mongolense]|uniref:ATP-grasp domain-containing protein n=1 Tax=Rhizobium mongolense TaxID=57676 RepID=UPI0035586FEE